MTAKTDLQITKNNTWVSLGVVATLLAMSGGGAWSVSGMYHLMSGISDNIVDINARIDGMEQQMSIALRGDEIKASIREDIRGYVRLLKAENHDKDITIPDF